VLSSDWSVAGAAAFGAAGVCAGAGAGAGCCAGSNIQGKTATSKVHVEAHNQRRRTSAGKDVFLIMTPSFYQSGSSIGPGAGETELEFSLL
jgi:hypothetical protein